MKSKSPKKQPTKSGPRKPKDLRYRDECFPNADAQVFKPRHGGYAPLPYIARELLGSMDGSHLKVWIYLLTRAGEYSICYPSYEDIQRSTKIASRGTVSKAIRKLERMGLIATHTDGGTRRYLLRDPRLALEKMYQADEISLNVIEEANDILDLVGREIISTSRPKKGVQP